MDLTSITTAFSAVKAAKDLGTALVELRDFNQVATTVTELNRKLLEAQDSIFTAQSKMLELQSEHLDTVNKLRKLEESLGQRRRYGLVELATGVFAYRLKPAEERQQDIEVNGDEPIHYICQPCMDTKGDRAVLVRAASGWGYFSLNCPICERKFATSEKTPDLTPPPPSYDPFRRL